MSTPRSGLRRKSQLISSPHTRLLIGIIICLVSIPCHDHPDPIVMTQFPDKVHPHHIQRSQLVAHSASSIKTRNSLNSWRIFSSSSNQMSPRRSLSSLIEMGIPPGTTCTQICKTCVSDIRLSSCRRNVLAPKKGQNHYKESNHINRVHLDNVTVWSPSPKLQSPLRRLRQDWLRRSWIFPRSNHHHILQMILQLYINTSIMQQQSRTCQKSRRIRLTSSIISTANCTVTRRQVTTPWKETKCRPWILTLSIQQTKIRWWTLPVEWLPREATSNGTSSGRNRSQPGRQGSLIAQTIQRVEPGGSLQTRPYRPSSLGNSRNIRS